MTCPTPKIRVQPGLGSDGTSSGDVILSSALSQDVKRAIANAKLAEFKRQAFRVGDIVLKGLLGRAIAADMLFDSAVSNGLVSEHGEDIIQALVAKGFAVGFTHE